MAIHHSDSGLTEEYSFVATECAWAVLFQPLAPPWCKNDIYWWGWPNKSGGSFIDHMWNQPHTPQMWHCTLKMLRIETITISTDPKTSNQWKKYSKTSSNQVTVGVTILHQLSAVCTENQIIKSFSAHRRSDLDSMFICLEDKSQTRLQMPMTLLIRAYSRGKMSVQVSVSTISSWAVSSNSQTPTKKLILCTP